VYAQTTTHITLLARLTGGGDTAAWREFCDRYEELIRGFGRRRGLAPADLDDVVQDVMLALTKSMPGFEYDPSKGKFRSYLKTVTLHAIFQRSRQNPGAAQLGSSAGTMSGVGPSDDETEETWEAEWRQYHLRMAMRTIKSEFNPDDLAAFESYAVHGHDAALVAGQLGMSVDAVYQAKSRILKRLSQVIGAQVAEEG